MSGTFMSISVHHLARQIRDRRSPAVTTASTTSAPVSEWSRGHIARMPDQDQTGE
jgi:hypothetical protein